MGVIFSALLTVGVLFVAYFLYLATQDVFLKESNIALEAELQSLRRVFENEGREELATLIQAKSLVTDRPFYYAHIVENTPTSYSDLTQWSQSDMQNVSLISDAQQFSDALPLAHTDIMLKKTRLTDGSLLIVARDVHDLDVAQWVARTFGSLTIVTLLTIGGLSLWVGYYVVNTINKIADTANSIIHDGKFEQRIPIDSSWDDLSKLSLALNHALDELALKVDGIRTVSDNIAHDLRTPFTRLRAHVELVKDDHQKQALLGEVDTILNMFNGLLRIADVESSKHIKALSTIDLKQLLEDVVELYQPLAEEKQQTLQCVFNVKQVSADADLLFQAFANLIDNAIKFTPEGGEITLTLDDHMRHAVVRICDSGPGVESKHVEKLTQRFFRTDKSRQTAGFGLGLAMVDAVVKRHKGRLAFSSNPHCHEANGLCCTVELPLYA